jgi:hypothetical protein
MAHCVVKVHHDENAESPREWDNLGVMACWHRRYNLGDVQPKEDPAEWFKENAPEGSVVLPLYLYDHSGLTMSTGSFGDKWDSGQVGWIVATPEAIRKNFMVKRITKAIRARAEEVLRSEVATYDDYLTGNVWGYTLDVSEACEACGSKVPKSEGSDSCWGFIGSDPSTLDAMKEHVEEEHHAALEAAWEKRGE